MKRSDGDGDGKPDIDPALLVDLKGAPVDYSSGGYVHEVSEAYGDPGR